MGNTIDAAQKDIVLRLVIEKSRNRRQVALEHAEWPAGFKYDDLEAILDQFTKMGLIDKITMNRRYLLVFVHLEADDFLNRGGFYGREVLFQKSVEDLLAEIELVKPSFGEKFERLTTIASNLLGFTALLDSGSKSY